MSFSKHQSTCMHFKGNMFVSKSMRMKHSTKCAVIYLGGHACMQFHTWQMENSVRFAYISICADIKWWKVINLSTNFNDWKSISRSLI